MAQGKVISSSIPSKVIGAVGNANAVIDNVDCDASVYVGAAVRMTDLGVAVNALADSIDNSNVLGIVEEKLSAVKCKIRISGLSESIYSGLDVTKEYYLHDVVEGLISTFIPIASGHIRLKVGQPYSTLKFVFMKGERLVRA